MPAGRFDTLDNRLCLRLIHGGMKITLQRIPWCGTACAAATDSGISHPCLDIVTVSWPGLAYRCGTTIFLQSVDLLFNCVETDDEDDDDDNDDDDDDDDFFFECADFWGEHSTNHSTPTLLFFSFFHFLSFFFFLSFFLKWRSVRAHQFHSYARITPHWLREMRWLQANVSCRFAYDP